MKEAISKYFRRRRFGFFMDFLHKVSAQNKPIRILDIGGTQHYWEHMGLQLGPNVEIVLLNLYSNEVTQTGFSSIIGNACDLQGIEDKSFDIVFSNSVIEHLFTLQNQQSMAKEVQRVGKSYFIQTPNKYFPMEPHWLFPCFQFLPFSIRVFLTQHFTLGHIQKTNNRAAAIQQVNEVRLLSYKEFKALFTNATIFKEQILGMTKSFTAYYIQE